MDIRAGGGCPELYDFPEDDYDFSDPRVRAAAKEARDSEFKYKRDQNSFRNSGSYIQLSGFFSSFAASALLYVTTPQIDGINLALILFVVCFTDWIVVRPFVYSILVAKKDEETYWSYLVDTSQNRLMFGLVLITAMFVSIYISVVFSVHSRPLSDMITNFAVIICSIYVTVTYSQPPLKLPVPNGY